MTYNPDDLVLIDQTVGNRYSLLGLTGIVARHQLDLLAVNPACLVDCIRSRLRTLHVLLAKCSVGTGHRARHTDFHISLNKRRNTQRCCYCEGQKTFLVERLRHEVVLLRFC